MTTKLNEDGFAVLILTHDRPDDVKTIRTMEKCGYTGPWFLVVDDEDDTLDQYVELYGSSRVYVFSKDGIAPDMDAGDNFGDKRCVVYARNAAFGIARELGYRYFIELDDDYDQFAWRFNGDLEYVPATVPIRDLDAVWGGMVEYLRQAEQLTSIAMAQGGDFIGGSGSNMASAIRTKRKVMNSFVCDVERPFKFPGRINEDVNAYVALQRQGCLFLTTSQVSLHQTETQLSPGGLTDIYLHLGTYVKSFYSVLHCPSAVKVTVMQSENPRIHHQVNYNACCPKVMRPMPVVKT